MAKKYEERFLKRIEWHKKMRTPYIMGGTDCSGTLAEAAFDAGLPFLRVTARDMSKGLGNWKGKTIKRNEAKPADLMFWHLDPEKYPHAHTGVKNTDKTYCHASFGKKYFLEDVLTSSFAKEAELFRHLTFGEDREFVEE